MTAGWSRPEYEALGRLVGTQAGLAFVPNRCDQAEAGMRCAMTKAGLTDVGAYLQQLEDGTVSVDDLIAELTVGETYFFREASQFEFIRREVLPDLLRCLSTDHVLRVWSAGCATGEEPYTLAILLDELGLSERARVFASDVCRPALSRAREAVYGRWSLRGIDQSVLQRYFQSAGGRHALDARIKERVTFGYLNLALDVYPSLATGIRSMDLILCRNVLIYFDPNAVRHVAQRLLLTLAPGGWLVTGPSDPPLSDKAAFATIVTGDGLFYRRGEDGLPSGGILAKSAAEPAPAPLGGLEPCISLSNASPAVGALPRADTVSPVDALAQARLAFEARDYDRVLELVKGRPEAEAAELSVRAVANRHGVEAAARLAAHATRLYPHSVRLHFVHAVLLLDLDRTDEAVQAVRRVLYLDRSLAMGHIVLAILMRRRGELASARRAYATAAELAAARPPQESVPLGDGECYGQLAQGAAVQAELLGKVARDG